MHARGSDGHQKFGSEIKQTSSPPNCLSFMSLNRYQSTVGAEELRTTFLNWSLSEAIREMESGMKVSIWAPRSLYKWTVGWSFTFHLEWILVPT